MPLPKIILGAFSPRAASDITDLSTHMLYYLAREGYLEPTYRSPKGKGRGRVRYYSYKDLVVARLIAQLLASGLEIARLKSAIAFLSEDTSWHPSEFQENARLLATDGNRLYSVQENGTLLDLTKDGQLAFSFVLDARSAMDEVRSRLTTEQRKDFSFYPKRLAL